MSKETTMSKQGTNRRNSIRPGKMMQGLKRLGALAAAVAGVGLFVGQAKAATPDNWLGGTDANWNTLANWDSGLPSATSDLIFPATVPGTGSTITLGAGELANSLSFNNSYSLTAGDMTLSTSGITVASGATVRISSALGGTAGVNLSGGTLQLLGTNTFTGGVTVTSGKLGASSDAAFGAAANSISLATGAALSNLGNFSTSRALNINGGATIDASFYNPAGVNLLPNTTVDNNTLNNGAALSLAGSLTGAGKLTKVGTGTLSINGANSIAGGLDLLAGTVSIGNKNAYFASTGAVTVYAGTRLNLTGTSGETWDLTNTTVNVGGVLNLQQTNNGQNYTANFNASKPIAGVLEVNNYTGSVATTNLHFADNSSLHLSTQASNITGTITIDSGYLNLGLGVNYGGSNGNTISANFAGSGGVRFLVSAGEPMTLSGANTFTGGVVKLSTDNVNFSGSNSTSAAVINSNTGTITIQGTAGQFANAPISTYGGSIVLNDNNGVLGSGVRVGNSITMFGGNGTAGATLYHKGVKSANTASGIPTVTLANGYNVLDAGIDTGGTAPYNADLTITNLARNTGASVAFQATNFSGSPSGNLGNAGVGTYTAGIAGRVIVTNLTPTTGGAAVTPTSALSSGIYPWGILSASSDWATYVAPSGNSGGVQVYTGYSANGVSGALTGDLTTQVTGATDNVKWTVTANTWTLDGNKSLNSLNVAPTSTVANTIALGANTMNLTSGGLMLGTTASSALNITGTGALTAGGTANAELFMWPRLSSTITVSAPITNNAGVDATPGNSDDGLVTLVQAGTSGTTVLTNTANSFSGGVFVNAGTLTSSSSTNTGKTLGPSSNLITLAGGTLKLLDNGSGSNQTPTSNTNLNYGYGVTVTTDSTLQIDRVGANTGNIIGLGALTVNAGRTLTITTGNTYGVQFASATLGASTDPIGVTIKNTVAPGSLVTNSFGAVTVNGPTTFSNSSLLFNIALGKLAGAGSMIVTSGGQVSLNGDATGAYTGKISLINGLLNIKSDGGASTTASITASSQFTDYPNMGVPPTVASTHETNGPLVTLNPAVVNFAVSQTTFPSSVTINSYAVIGGDLTNAVYAGAGKNVTFGTNAMVLNGSTNAPSAPSASIMAGSLYLAVNATNSSITGIDPVTTVYKGAAFVKGAYNIANNGAAADYTGSLSAVSGSNLEIFLLSSQQFQASSGQVTLDANGGSGAGTVNIYGPGTLTLRSNGANSVIKTDNSTLTVNRAGRATGQEQNTDLISLNKNAAGDTGKAFPAGTTINVTDGRFRYGAADATAGLMAGSTVNINAGGALWLDQKPLAGTFNINSGGFLYMSNADRLSGGATFGINSGALVSFVPGADVTTTNTIGASGYIGAGLADYILASQKYSGAGIVLGQNRRITTDNANNNPTITAGGGGISAAAGATNVILSAANGRTLTINDSVNLSGVNLQIGDTNAFLTVNNYSSDATRYAAAQTGAVTLNGNVTAGSAQVVSGSASLGSSTGTVTIAGDLTVSNTAYAKIAGQNAAVAAGTFAAHINLNNSAALEINQTGTASTWQTFATPIVVSTTGANSTQGYNLYWNAAANQWLDISTVKMTAGATMKVAANNDTTTQLRFSAVQLNGDSTLYLPPYFSFYLGNVTLGSGTAASLQLNRNGNDAAYNIHVSGTLNAGTTVYATDKFTTTLDSTFRLNGGAYTLGQRAGGGGSGQAQTSLYANPTAEAQSGGTINNNASSNYGTFNIYTDQNGSISGGWGANVTINTSRGQTTNIYVDDDQTNLFNGTMAVVHNAADTAGNVDGYIKVYRGVAGTNQGTVSLPAVQLGEGARAQFGNDGGASTAKFTAAVSLAGNGVLDNALTTGANLTVGNVTGTSSAYALTLRGGNTQLSGTLSNPVNVGAAGYAGAATLISGANLGGQTMTAINGTLTVSAAAGSGILDAKGGTVSLQGNAPAATVRISAAGTLSVSSGGAGATRQLGNLIYNGGNAITWGVAGDMVNVNGYVASAGTVTAADLSHLTFAAGSGFSPGTGSPGVATMTLGTVAAPSNFTAPAGFAYHWDYAGNPPTANDKFVVNGNFEMAATGANPTLYVKSLGIADPTGQSFVIASWTGTGPANQPAWNVDLSGAVSANTDIIWDGGAGDNQWKTFSATGGNWKSPGIGGTGVVTYDMANKALILSGLDQSGSKRSTGVAASSTVLIAPTSATAVIGPDIDTTIAALTIGGPSAAATSLNINAGRLTVSGQTDLQNNGSLLVNQAFTTGTLTVNAGGSSGATVAAGKTLTANTSTTVNSGLLDVTGNLATPSLTIAGGTANFNAGNTSSIALGTLSGGTTTLAAGSFTTANLSAAAILNATGGAITNLNLASGMSGSATISGSAAITNAVVAGGTASFSQAPAMTSLQVTGGSATLSTHANSLTVSGGVVNTASSTSVGSAAITGGTVNTGANYLSVNNQLDVTGANNRVVITNPAGFQAKGANLTSSVDTVKLTGGTTTLTYYGSGSAAGLDVRAWKYGSNGASLDTYTGSATANPPNVSFNNSTLAGRIGTSNDSTFSGTIGYATQSINMGNAGPREHFGAGANSGVPDSALRPTGYSLNYTVEYRGKLYVPTDGTYTFATASDDGSAVWIDQSANPLYATAAVQNNYAQGLATRGGSFSYSLTGGTYHDIIVRYNQGGGNNALQLFWDPAGGTNWQVIPGADFYHVGVGSTPATANLPSTAIVASTTSTLDLGSAGGSHILGDLSLSSGVALTLAGSATSVSFHNVTGAGTTTITSAAPVTVRGSITPAGRMSVGNSLKLDNASGNSASLRITGDASANTYDQVSVTGNLDLFTAGTLTLSSATGLTSGGTYHLFTTTAGIFGSNFSNSTLADASTLPALPAGLAWHDFSAASGLQWINNTGASIDVQIDALSGYGSGAWSNGGGTSNWNLAANWSGLQPNGAGHVATFNATGAGTVHVDQLRTVGGMIFNSATAYTIGVNGGNAITFDNSGSDAALTLTAGNHTIAAPVYLANGLAVSGSGSVALTGDLHNAEGFFSAGFAITKTDAGTLTISGTQTHGDGAALNVAGGLVNLNSDAGDALIANLSVTISAGQVKLGSNQHLNDVTLTGGSLDIADKATTVKNSTVGAGSWTGTAYTGLTAKVVSHALTTSITTNPNKGVGIITGQDAINHGNTTFHGSAIAGGDVLIQYGWNGDLNMDGKVSYLDYGAIDNAYLYNRANPTPRLGYANGDINLDGVINYLDYGMMDNAFLTQNAPRPVGDLNGDGTITYLDYAIIDNAFLTHAPATPANGDLNGDGIINFVDYGMMDNAFLTQNAPAAASAALSSSAVPEPAAMSLLAMGALGLLARRRRQN